MTESVQPLPEHCCKKGHGKPKMTMTLMHSHHNLKEIFFLLWDQRLAPRGSFIDLVFRLVMFHQSLDGCPMWPPMFSLSEAERDTYCDE